VSIGEYNLFSLPNIGNQLNRNSDRRAEPIRLQGEFFKKPPLGREKGIVLAWWGKLMHDRETAARGRTIPIKRNKIVPKKKERDGGGGEETCLTWSTKGSTSRGRLRGALEKFTYKRPRSTFTLRGERKNPTVPQAAASLSSWLRISRAL